MVHAHHTVLHKRNINKSMTNKTKKNKMTIPMTMKMMSTTFHSKKPTAIKIYLAGFISLLALWPLNVQRMRSIQQFLMTRNDDNNSSSDSYNKPSILSTSIRETSTITEDDDNNKIISNATIVTAFYEVDNSGKHKTEDYIQWMDYIFSLQDPMIIFTSNEFASIIQNGRAKYDPTMKKTKIIIQELNKTGIANMFTEYFWHAQHGLDPERNHHKSYELYWIWLAKTELLYKGAVKLNPFQSQFFAWVDIGYFRTHEWKGQRLLQHVPQNLTKHQVMMLQYPLVANCIAAGIIAGYKEGVIDWYNAFQQTIHHHAFYPYRPPNGKGDANFSNDTSIIHKNPALQAQTIQFIGKEQPMILQTCMENPTLCKFVYPPAHHAKYGSMWFFMAPYLIYGEHETGGYLFNITSTQLQGPFTPIYHNNSSNEQ